MRSSGVLRFVAGWLVGLGLLLWGVLAVHDAAYLIGLAVLALTTIGFAGAPRLQTAGRSARSLVRVAGLAIVAVGVVVPLLWPLPSERATTVDGGDELADGRLVHAPVLGTTTDLVAQGSSVWWIDRSTGALQGPVPAREGWAMAAGGDVVSVEGRDVIREGRDGTRLRATIDLRAPEGRPSNRRDPRPVAATERTVVVAVCNAETTCRLAGIDRAGDVTWTEETGTVSSTAFVQLSSPARLPTQVVLTSGRGVTALDPDTGEERDVLQQTDDSQLYVRDDLIVLRTGSEGGCRYVVRRGPDVETDVQTTCGGLLPTAARRGERLWLGRFSPADPAQVLDLRRQQVTSIAPVEQDEVLLAGWDAVVEQDAGRIGVRDRFARTQRWSREIGPHELVGAFVDTIVVKQPGAPRLLKDSGERLLVLDAEDGRTLGSLHVPRGAVDGPDGRGPSGVVGVPGGVLVQWLDDDDESRLVLIGSPREADSSDAPLDGNDQP